MADVKTAVFDYVSPACRTVLFKNTRCQKSQSGPEARLCARPLLPSTRLTTHPPSKQAQPPTRTLDDTTPTPTPFTLRNTAFACISSCYHHIVANRKLFRSHIHPTTRLLILRRARPRDLRVTTSTTPPTLGRKAFHPPPPTIFAPDSASIGSPLLAAAHSHHHVLFRVAIGQDRPIGACLAGFQLGAQTHKAERAAVGSREQCKGHHRPGPGAHGFAFEWTVIAGCRQNLQQEG